ncbi:actin-interacting protein-like protein [Leishmania tarentolae]|uniref:Actin-interacting protein-like protein n=1 Tax=Leishmania tarentolae TaxID=5689 RepID=A0A640KHL7_LEITA|nr:actin-interacting protein-like protein [Leishmania tarentolae]
MTGAADRTRIVCFHSAPSPPSLSALQSSPPETQGDDTRPPALTGRSHSSAEQPEEKISPETPLPCRCVHGSILPPVYYPPLVARLLD